MKNLFKISHNSDNITPLSPNPPPHNYGARQRTLEKKQSFPYSPNVGGNPGTNDQYAHNGSYSQQHSSHQFQRKISAPIETSTSIRIGLDQLYDVHNGNPHGPPIRLNLPKKPTLPRNHQETAPYYYHLNSSLSSQHLPVQPKTAHQPEKVVRSFSDSSVIMEKVPTSSTSFSSSQATTSSMSTITPESTPSALKKDKTLMSPTKRFAEKAGSVAGKLRKPKSTSVLGTFSSKKAPPTPSSTLSINSPFEYDFNVPHTPAKTSGMSNYA